MDPRHEAKIDELIDTLSSSLKISARRLLNSGAIDPDEYNPDEYRLAKILVTAAMHDQADAYAPFREDDRKTLKNLSHF